MPEERESPHRLADRDDARCSFCGDNPRKVGPLVQGEGPGGVGGVFICEECADLVLHIIAQEKRRRGAIEETPKVTVTRPTLNHMRELVRQSVIEHKGTLPKESALVWFGYFASLLAWELLSVEDFDTLMKSLPDYPADPVVQRILCRRSPSPDEA